jgi:hypothetical protein
MLHLVLLLAIAAAHPKELEVLQGSWSAHHDDTPIDQLTVEGTKATLAVDNPSEIGERQVNQIFYGAVEAQSAETFTITFNAKGREWIYMLVLDTRLPQQPEGKEAIGPRYIRRATLTAPDGKIIPLRRTPVWQNGRFIEMKDATDSQWHLPFALKALSMSLGLFFAVWLAGYVSNSRDYYQARGRAWANYRAAWKAWFKRLS